MLPTFVIGLREGLEAALIVGIIAAFLRQQGRRDLLRWVFAGVTVAVLLCVGVGAALEVLSKNLPQQKQEGLETVVGALAVVMVTYMVVWMRRHSRELKGTLEAAAGAALAEGSSRAARAMVVMACLAVLREGFETVVFLLAAFNETGNGAAPIAGAVLGIVIAVGLGWGIYRGGVRINLSRFFRITGLVLVAVAAGLVVTALHTAHEAGWLNVGQGATVNLTWLVRPGSVQASLLTGILGIQDHPVVIEVVGWLVYLVPVGLYVGWPPGRGIAPRKVAAVTAIAAALAGIATVAVAATVPHPPKRQPITDYAGQPIQVESLDGTGAMIQVPPAPHSRSQALRLTSAGTGSVHGMPVERYRGRTSGVVAGASLARSLSQAAIAARNGGRLPLGVTASRNGTLPATYRQGRTVTVSVEPTTERVLDVTWTSQVTTIVHSAVGAIPLSRPLNRAAAILPGLTAASAAVAAHSDRAALERRHHRHLTAWWLLALTLSLAVTATASLIRVRRAAPPPTPLDTSSERLIQTKVRLT